MILVGRTWASRPARVGIVALLALLHFSSLAAPLSFIHIADTRLGQFMAISSSPTISSNGVVAFHAMLTSGGQGIFTGTGGPTTTIADSSGMFNTFSTHPRSTHWERSRSAQIWTR